MANPNGAGFFNRVMSDAKRQSDPNWPQGNRFSFILLILGVFLSLPFLLIGLISGTPMTGGALSGVFFIFIWSILNARISRARVNYLRNQYVSAWRNEIPVKASFRRVAYHSFFAMLPIYMMWLIPGALAAGIGLTGWSAIGIPFTVISALALASFSRVWQDMYISLWKFWLMNLAVWLLINGGGLTIYYLR